LSRRTHAPKGQLADERTSWEIDSSDQLFKRVDYLPLIVAAKQGAVVRLADLGTVIDVSRMCAPPA
jgi:multidrug efflux pump subunit AcrB